MAFLTRNGVNYAGTATYAYPPGAGRQAPVLAILSGERDIRIVIPELGVEFRGYVELAGELTVTWRMTDADRGRWSRNDLDAAL